MPGSYGTSLLIGSQVDSSIGAVISCITITLIVVTAFLIYKVYFVGEMRIEEPVKEAKDAGWIEEEQ